MGSKKWKLTRANISSEVEELRRQHNLPRPIALYFAAREITAKHLALGLTPYRTARHRDSTVCTFSITAILNFDKSTGTGGVFYRHRLEGSILERADRHPCCAAALQVLEHKGDNRHFVFCAEDNIDTGYFGECLGVALTVTANDGNRGTWIMLYSTADNLP